MCLLTAAAESSVAPVPAFCIFVRLGSSEAIRSVECDLQGGKPNEKRGTRRASAIIERNMCRCGESDSVDDFTVVDGVKLSAGDDMEEVTARRLEELRLALVQELYALLDDIYRRIDEHAALLARLDRS
uniref:FIP-RBD domain-containing protein n=1 Tax=Ascaris lumbricoides TaxID=6252 RepID=A0A9J2NZ26_ASCLU